MKLTFKGFLFGLLLSAAPAMAQEERSIARLDAAASSIQDARRATTLTLAMSQAVPYRVFTLDDPRRLVLDFREVDFRGLDEALFDQSDAVDDVRFGPLRPGWSRMILGLSKPLSVETAEMAVDPADATAVVKIVLRTTSPEDFAASAGAPDDPDWAFVLRSDPVDVPPMDGDVETVVVIDPGHGGLDPGAEHGDVQEADVMLSLALEVREALSRVDGVRAVVTREDDIFVPLLERLSLARRARADLFISLHADALEGPQATGASIYMLTDEASDVASMRMVERHEGGDLLAGIDLSGQTDEVATVLQDLVRVETAASAERFAQALVTSMEDTGVVMNSKPRRRAVLAVLNAADFASVLIEAGFLSNADDRARLTSAQGRAPIVEAVALAVARWALEEEMLAPLNRQ